MKHIHRENWYWYKDRAWPINANISGVYTHILQPLLSQYIYMLEQYSKVFVYRLDIHLATYTKTNKVMTDFNRHLRKRIQRHYNIKDIAYCWVREQEKAKQQHYHYVLMLNGHKVRHPHTINNWIFEIANKLDLSRPSVAGYHFIRRDKSDYNEKLQNTCYHISYLAKVRGKGYRSTQTNDYSTSRLKLSTKN